MCFFGLLVMKRERGRRPVAPRHFLQGLRKPSQSLSQNIKVGRNRCTNPLVLTKHRPVYLGYELQFCELRQRHFRSVSADGFDSQDNESDVLAAVLQRRVVWRKPDVSQELAASIFMVED
jgi:hypothetical protein